MEIRRFEKMMLPCSRLMACVICLGMLIAPRTLHAQWTPLIVDTGGLFVGDAGYFSSLAVVNGKPAISYYDSTNGNLKYVQGSDANGATWGTRLPVDAGVNVGRYTSLAVVNGNPAISYYDFFNADLKYLRADDSNGASWLAPSVAVDAGGDVGLYTSLAVVNGNPAISYYDQTNADLKFVRANDPGGAAWAAPVTVDGLGSAQGRYTSLVVVNGNPAIAYYDLSNADLKYVRAGDVNGASWLTPPVAVDTAGDVGQYTSLAVVNGNPAIAYYDNTNFDLKYVRANDINGASWLTLPVAVDTAGSVGSYPSLAVVDGNPAISYYDSSNADLKYVQADDPNGASWLILPVAADSVGDVGRYSSLAVVNGNPAIAYYNYDSNNGNLKYAHFVPVPNAMRDWGMYE